MIISPKQDQKLVIVCIYDILPLDKVKLDDIRKENIFEIIGSVGENIIVFNSPAKNIEISLQMTRLEYTDSSNTVFHKRNLEIFEKTLQSLPPLRIKAIGINLHCIYTIEDISATEFIRNKFLKDKESLEESLEKSILGSSVRVFYGEPNDHFDLRLYPLQLTGRDLGIAIHEHKDIDVAQQEKLIKLTYEMFYRVCEEKNKIEAKILKE